MDMCKCRVSRPNAVQHPAIRRPQPIFTVEHCQAVQRTGHIAAEQLAGTCETERIISFCEDPEAAQRTHDAAECSRIRTDADRQAFGGLRLVREMIRKVQFGRDVQHLRDAEAHDHPAQARDGRPLRIRYLSQPG